MWSEHDEITSIVVWNNLNFIVMILQFKDVSSSDKRDCAMRRKKTTTCHHHKNYYHALVYVFALFWRWEAPKKKRMWSSRNITRSKATSNVWAKLIVINKVPPSRVDIKYSISSFYFYFSNQICSRLLSLRQRHSQNGATRQISFIASW